MHLDVTAYEVIDDYLWSTKSTLVFTSLAELVSEKKQRHEAGRSEFWHAPTCHLASENDEPCSVFRR